MAITTRIDGHVGGFGIELVGLNEAVATLSRLKRAINLRVIKKAVRAGAAPTVKAAKQLAPRRFGFLKRSITLKMRQYQAPGSVLALAIVGPKVGTYGKNQKPSKYAHLVEKGTKPHDIPRFARPLRLTPGGKRLTRGRVQIGVIKHPGTKGTRFLRRAFRSTNRLSKLKFAEKLAAETIIEAAKALAKAKGAA